MGFKNRDEKNRRNKLARAYRTAGYNSGWLLDGKVRVRFRSSSAVMHNAGSRVHDLRVNVPTACWIELKLCEEA